MLRLLVFGGILASIYMLLAIGMSLIFGVARIINLAHTAYFMAAAYFFWYFSKILGLFIILAAVVAVVSVTLIGLCSYWFLIKPIKEHSYGKVAIVIITVAIGIVIREVALLTTAGKTHTVSYIIPGTTSLMGTAVLNQQLLVFTVAPIIVLIVWTVINKTEFGIAVQATSQDAEIANLVGINTEKMNMMVMGLSVFLAGTAAVLVAPITVVTPQMWEAYLFPVITVVVLGGFGSIKGSIIAAIILGFLLSSVSFLFPMVLFTNRALSLLILVIVLLLRPGGIAGVPLEHFWDLN